MSIKKKGSEVKKLRRLSLAQLPPHCPDQLGAPHRCALPQECVHAAPDCLSGSCPAGAPGNFRLSFGGLWYLSCGGGGGARARAVRGGGL